MKWFRLYDEIQYDPKLRRMPIPHRYAFIVLLCIANRSKVRGAIINLDDDDLAFELEMELEDWLTLKAKFRAKGLIEPIEGGIKISNWDERQFASDSSAERVKRYREKRAKRECNVTETLVKRDGNDEETLVKRHVTPSDTDPDPDPEKKEKKEKSTASASASTASQGGKPKPQKKPPKKLTKVQCQELVDIYHELKPELWAEVKVLGEKRLDMADRAYQSMGRDIEATKAIVSSALRYVSTQDWWTEKKGKFTFGTLFERGKGGQGEYRFIEWSELESSKESQEDVKKDRVGAAIRQEIDRLRINGVVPEQFRGSPDQMVVSQLGLDSATRYLDWLRQQPDPKPAWENSYVAA